MRISDKEFTVVLRKTGRVLLCCYLVATSWASLRAAIPADQLLPATTKGVALIPNWDKLETAFDATQLGQLMQDPVMQPFFEDLKSQLREKGSRRLEKLGVSLDDLRGIPGGEIAAAIVLPNATTAATILIVDVTGHEKEAADLRAKIAKNLTAQGGQQLATEEGVTRFQLPKTQQHPELRVVANFLKGQTLVLTDNAVLAKEISRGIDQPRADSLSTLKSYRETRGKLAGAAKGLEPQVGWFVDPFGYADAMRILDPKTEKKNPDLLKVLRNQGFAAVQAIGGFVNFSTGPQELLHRTYVYAPGNSNAKDNDRYTLAARLLDFPVSTDLHVQTWIPREIATYATFNWNLRDRFQALETLVDEYAAQKGVFRDVLESLRDEKDGPKVDVEKEIIDNLGVRVTMMTDYELPITPKSERLLFGAEIDMKKNPQPEKTIAEALNRLMQSDERMRRVDYQGIIIWEAVTEKTEALPELEIVVAGGGIAHTDAVPTAYQAPKGRPGRGGARGKARPGQVQQQEKILPNQAVCVAHGHLFIASHKDILIKVLDHANQVRAKQNAGVIAVGKISPSLDSSADLNMVLIEMEQEFGAKEICMRAFSRTDEEYRPTYELIRTNQMPKSETLFGKMLNGMFGDGKPGNVRENKIDGGKLPNFEVVRRYLGPAGAFVTADAEGWMLTGFTLRKAVNAAANPAPVVR